MSEVLLVWNGGGDPPSLPSISSQAPVRIRAESQVSFAGVLVAVLYLWAPADIS